MSKLVSLYMDISKSIKGIRESKGFTQKDMGDKMGLEQSNYARFERRGDKLTIEQLKQIATALEVSLKDILFGEDNQANPDLAKLETTLQIEKYQSEQYKNQKVYFLDNILKFILNIDHLLQKKVVNYAIGEVINLKQNDYQAFVRCYCELGSEVFTLATWQKPINKDTAHFAHLEQNGEYLFDTQHTKQANQYKDVAFANIQQNHELWTINFINLTAFFRVAFEQRK